MISVKRRPSDPNTGKFNFSRYSGICGQLRTLLNMAFKRYRARPPSQGSISNPSIVTAEDSVEEVEELSPSEQFNWNRMANIFSEYQITYVGMGEELSPETLYIVQVIFDNLVTDELKYAEFIYDSIIKLDRSYAERFFSYSQLPKIRPREHMTKHIKKIMEFHRLIICAFQDDRTKALQILNLLALSHVLMHVYITDFRLFDLAIGKFLYRMEMVDDINVHQVIGYMATVTTHVDRLLRRHSLENRKRELLLSDNGEFLLDSNSVYRETYRELKKWYQIQLILRKAVADREEDHQHETTLMVRQHESTSAIFKPSSHDLEMSPSDFSSGMTPSKMASDEMEGWFIDFLKRGYKYKLHDKPFA